MSTWAAIGHYVGRDARTAKRYEVERGLPVRRMPGSAKSTVHAYTDELDVWLASSRVKQAMAAAPAKAAPAEPAPIEAGWNGRGKALLCAGVVAIALLATAGLGVLPRPRDGTAAALQDYRAGEYAWEKRTPDSLLRAVDAFTQSIVADPRFAPAYVGLADCYNLLPEFGDMTPVDAFPRANAAAERAVALEPQSAAAHRSLAFALFWWGGDRDRAMTEFRTALRVYPDSAQSHHWYAKALAAELDPAAEQEIARAGELNPTSTAIKADAGWVAYMLRRYGEAIAILTEVADVDPGYATSFRYRAAAKRAVGDYPGMLADLTREADLRKDQALGAVVATAKAALDTGGPTAMFKSLAAGEERLFDRSAFPASRLATDEFMAGDRPRALALLAVTKQRREWFASAVNNPAFGAFRRDPKVVRLRGA